ncbi:type I polyketide synthase [Rhodovulum adriaticum]|uniref:Acyl transferase domain-containing protein n=1 Tax=Rhodovulum adriaticum TaxID=35804 RepID=A0A4R2NUZ8_RHOAD|nr:type I polyketide synthase [Rhodovulum adriaticum]MBK1635013.1 hypothetical protein [Rhodovulum adriaticum]TCP25354.1 acyl transferase domain-containing protein [Rhodovulum adriaticum]
MTGAPGQADGGQTPIAIVGMAGLFPKSPDKETFWRNILSKADCVSDAPADWHADLFLDADSSDNDRVYTARGGFLGDLARFDPLRHGVMPSSVDGGEPDQFLALDLAADALEDADFDARPVPGDRVAVILGRGTYINRGFTSVVQHGVMVDRFLDVLRRLHPDTGDDELAEVKRQLKASLPPFNAEIAPALVPNLVTGRIANRLDFRGANYIIDAACASSLIALDRGVADLQAGRCDMAIVGGVHASTPVPIYQIFCQLEALSRQGQIRPFSAEADGTLLGEGVGILCLKRLEEAEAAGDRIYALVRGVGVASDGKGSGILAPRIEGEMLALERAYAQTGIDPATVSLIEAHGTATTVGDEAEITALSRQFGGRGPGMPDCALGTVKSNIAHCLPASGAAGLIKTALALHHRVLPPTRVETPNPALAMQETPLYLNTEARPWVQADGTPRRAGVNAFGFGGINAHAVLEEYTGGAQPVPVVPRETEVLALDGDSAEALLARIADLRAALDTAPSLDDLAAQVNAGLGQGTWRAAIVATDPADAHAKLDKIATALGKGKTRMADRRGSYLSADPLGASGKVAFMFPGEGSQHVGMLRELMLHYPEMRGWFDLVDGACTGMGRDVLPGQVIFPKGESDGGAGLWRMDIGPEAIFAANQAVFELYQRLGLRCDMSVGHSSGEYSALYAAGVTRRDDPAQLKDEIRAVNAAYQALMADGVVASGILIAVGAVDAAALAERVGERDDLFLAMDNCPGQAVVATSSPDAADWLEGAIAALGGFAERLPFERAYHCPAFKGFSEGLLPHLQSVAFDPPQIPVYSCVTTEPFPPEAEAIRALTAAQWSERVRFTETVRRMHADGARIFVECGPRNTLCAFVNDILRGQPHVAVAADTAGRTGLVQLHHLAARLAVEGVPFDIGAVGAPQSSDQGAPRGMPLRTGIQPMKLTGEPPVRRPADTGAPAAPEDEGNSAAPEQPAAGDRAVAAYYDTMSQFLTSETQIMQAYLGQAPAAQPVAAPQPTADRFPLLAQVEPAADGRSLTARLRFDTDAMPFLRDHCFGNGISHADPALLGVSIVPLTFTMEVLAEAAAALRPSMVVTGMREMRGSRWLKVDETGLELEALAEARHSDDPNAITVRLREAGSAKLRPILAEAIVELAPHPVPAPEASLASSDDPTGAPWTRQDIYSRIMFHGPSLQALDSMDRATPDWADGRILGVPQEPLLAHTDRPYFELDPVTLDAVGQLVGVWAAETLDSAFHVFPFRAERLEVFRRPLAAGEAVQCRCKIARPGADDLRSDIEVVCADGHLQCRLTGWWDKRFDLPEGFFQARLDPASAFVSRVLRPEGLPGAGISLCLLNDLDDAFLESGGGIWGDTLARLALSRPERAEWAEMAGAVARRRWDWLRGRVAVKDAVRALTGQGPCLADIPILATAEGAPQVADRPGFEVQRPPHVSISHTAELALGAAADPALFAGIGVDVEKVTERDAAFVSTAFSVAEGRYLDALPKGEERNRAVTRLWCAHEATSKAFGLGIESFSRFVPDLDSATEVNLKMIDSETNEEITTGFLYISCANCIAAIALRVHHGEQISDMGNPR